MIAGRVTHDTGTPRARRGQAHGAPGAAACPVHPDTSDQEVQVRDMRQFFALGAMILMVATPAAAQFTTVVAPPKKVVATVDALVADPTPRDTGRRATLQEMSAWVDSVAGTATNVAAAPPVVDSASGEVVAPAHADAPTERFTDGARAPNTASPLPALLVLGLGAMIAGASMLATRRREG